MSETASALSLNERRQAMANAVRALAIDAVEAANSGHPGLPLGCADIAAVLFGEVMKIAPWDPSWPDRDRFILSAGHGSALLYAVNHLLGFEAMTLEEVKNFRQLGSHTAGHPERDLSLGIETTTGPLGQGLANAVGMAIAEAHLAARFDDTLINHHTYVLASDGDLMEGISHEACSLAGHMGLGNLIVLFDDNSISIDGSTDLSVSDDATKRFEAYGWDVQAIDGHDGEAIADALAKAKLTKTPSLIRCRTTIGFGSPKKAGTSAAHGAPLGAEELEATKASLAWYHEPFVVPDDIRALWTAAAERSRKTYDAWQGRLKETPSDIRNEFERAMAGAIPLAVDQALDQLKADLRETKPKQATRQASGNVIAALDPVLPSLVGGSADLSGSNNTRAKTQQGMTADDFSGRYVHYGVREHAMAAAMNGMALHGGVIPYGGTFLVFSDYCRPSVRLSALMRQRVIYIFTHDSIGVGEDGPTHQPVEHLAALRSIPGLKVYRPCDGIETAECWRLALGDDGPSAMALTRQGLPTLRVTETAENLSGQGGYVLHDPEGGDANVVLIATGSEVSLAMETAKALAAQNLYARVVSMPCVETFLALPADARAKVLPAGVPRVGIEAALSLGWERVIGENGLFCGMSGFGASGPGNAVYAHFGLTPDAIAKRVVETFFSN